MTENRLTVDLDRLRVLADRLERTANELKGFRPLALDAADLLGSDTCRATQPEPLADVFDPILQALTRWALEARAAADALADMDSANARQFTGP